MTEENLFGSERYSFYDFKRSVVFRRKKINIARFHVITRLVKKIRTAIVLVDRKLLMFYMVMWVENFFRVSAEWGREPYKWEKFNFVWTVCIVGQARVVCESFNWRVSRELFIRTWKARSISSASVVCESLNWRVSREQSMERERRTTQVRSISIVQLR